MKVHVFAVYDSKAKLFGQPMFAQAIGQMMRSFEDAINGDVKAYAGHPEDFSLFHVGLYDDNTGRLEPLENPVQLVLGLSLVRRSPQLELSDGGAA